MIAKQTFKELDITVRGIDASADAIHKHYFYQIIYVVEGSGVHIINGYSYTFKVGDIFLLTPEDIHSYEYSSPPVFCIIDFTKNFFFKQAGSKEEKMDVSEIFKELETVFKNQYRVDGILLENEERTMFEVLIKQLITEKTIERTFGKIITQNIIFLILNLIARNLKQRSSIDFTNAHLKLKVNEVITYIQTNIFENDRLSIQALSEYFSISAGHLSRCFKAETGRTIKNYTTNYKLEIIQSKLKYSGLTISEIAYEMKFTDESHLNKVFKNALGVTAKQFRRGHKSLK